MSSKGELTMRLNNQGQGQTFLIMIVVGALLGVFGSSTISRLNPFKAKKVPVAKQQAEKTEYFRDKVKGVEYKLTEKSKGQTPVIQKQTIGGLIDRFIKQVVAVGVILFLGSLVFGRNLFVSVKKMKNELFAKTKTLKQLVVGVSKAKAKMNGEKIILTDNLSKATDEDSKKIINEIKNEKSIE